ncbi:hypothetical protein [Halogeometricum borinquense]|uniref:hypothetical protein n=1 Tax=Halogeometricum borinquense TaxID=60847 RepID=UPI001EF83A76|nr:hypothetical protein [Halogeometricum borinquense]
MRDRRLRGDGSRPRTGRIGRTRPPLRRVVSRHPWRAPPRLVLGFAALVFGTSFAYDISPVTIQTTIFGSVVVLTAYVVY